MRRKKKKISQCCIKQEHIPRSKTVQTQSLRFSEENKSELLSAKPRMRTIKLRGEIMTEFSELETDARHNCVPLWTWALVRWTVYIKFNVRFVCPISILTSCLGLYRTYECSKYYKGSRNVGCHSIQVVVVSTKSVSFIRWTIRWTKCLRKETRYRFNNARDLFHTRTCILQCIHTGRSTHSTTAHPPHSSAASFDKA